MRSVALHDELRLVLLVQLRTVPDCGFPVALYEDDPAQTVSQYGISLPAAHTRVAPAPATLAWRYFVASAVPVVYARSPCADEVYFLPLAWSLWCVAIATVPLAMVLMCAAVASHLTGFAEYLYVDAEIPVHRAAVFRLKNP